MDWTLFDILPSVSIPAYRYPLSLERLPDLSNCYDFTELFDGRRYYFAKRLDVTNSGLFTLLLDYGILTSQQIEACEAQATNFDKATTMINTLEKCDGMKLPSFIDALRITRQISAIHNMENVQPILDSKMYEHAAAESELNKLRDEHLFVIRRINALRQIKLDNRGREMSLQNDIDTIERDVKTLRERLYLLRNVDLDDVDDFSQLMIKSLSELSNLRPTQRRVHSFQNIFEGDDTATCDFRRRAFSVSAYDCILERADILQTLYERLRTRKAEIGRLKSELVHVQQNTAVVEQEILDLEKQKDELERQISRLEGQCAKLKRSIMLCLRALLHDYGVVDGQLADYSEPLHANDDIAEQLIDLRQDQFHDTRVRNILQFLGVCQADQLKVFGRLERVGSKRTGQQCHDNVGSCKRGRVLGSSPDQDSTSHHENGGSTVAENLSQSAVEPTLAELRTECRRIDLRIRQLELVKGEIEQQEIAVENGIARLMEEVIDLLQRTDSLPASRDATILKLQIGKRQQELNKMKSECSGEKMLQMHELMEKENYYMSQLEAREREITDLKAELCRLTRNKSNVANAIAHLETYRVELERTVDALLQEQRRMDELGEQLRA